MSSANNKTSTTVPTTVAYIVQKKEAEIFDLNCKLQKKENEKDDELTEKEEKIRELEDNFEVAVKTSQTFIAVLDEKDDELTKKEEKIRVLEKEKEVLEYRSGALQQMLRTSYDQSMEMQVELNKSRQQLVSKAKEREEAANTRTNESSRKRNGEIRTLLKLSAKYIFMR